MLHGGNKNKAKSADELVLYIMTGRINVTIQKITILQCYATTNNAEPYEKQEFYNKLRAMIESAPNRDILIIMGDFDVKVGRNNASIERIMGEEGLGDVNENEKELVELQVCALNDPSIGGTLFLHNRVHKAIWVSPDGVIENQIDYILICQRWRRSLQDKRFNWGATIGSDHHLVVASLKIKLAARKPLINTRRTFDVVKLRDPGKKKAFEKCLQQREEVRNVNGDGGEQPLILISRTRI